MPLQAINDIFITHLHVNHYGELPYLFCFAPWAGRWVPLRVHGPSGRTKDEGIAHMVNGMQYVPCPCRSSTVASCWDPRNVVDRRVDRRLRKIGLLEVDDLDGLPAGEDDALNEVGLFAVAFHLSHSLLPISARPDRT